MSRRNKFRTRIYTLQAQAFLMLRSNLHRRRKPLGAALVEFAVCIPVLMLLILGSLEATSAIFVRQALTTSAYEGIREAIRTGATIAGSTARAQKVLDDRRIKSATIRFEPSDFPNVARGSAIAIEVSASFRPNSPFFGNVIADRTTTVRTVMVKE